MKHKDKKLAIAKIRREAVEWSFYKKVVKYDYSWIQKSVEQRL